MNEFTLNTCYYCSKLHETNTYDRIFCCNVEQRFFKHSQEIDVNFRNEKGYTIAIVFNINGSQTMLFDYLNKLLEINTLSVIPSTPQKHLSFLLKQLLLK